jgi:diaminohydroxyphosphoribosylaminopyrimidine deaminase/5-amino-6-(5-phosphoribosylamino)uracil reductase
MSDEMFMKKALSLAARGTGRTSPNPLVGAVVVKGGKIIAADYHKKAGTPHAEALALEKAGKLARGSTLYVNLEPCCHTEKRTPPCTKSIIRSGVRKVVSAMIDPNPKVSGMGLRELRRAGIETETGIMEKEAKELNEFFIKFITKREPFTLLKIAESLDGRIATASGESKWITGEKSRAYVHKLRNEVDAVLVGINTVTKDDPSLDCRIKGGRNPYRIIVDSKLRIPLDAKVLHHDDGKTIIAAVQPHENSSLQRNYRRKIERLSDLGVRVLSVKEKDGMVDLKSLVKELGRLHITSLMIEGGSSINASALSAGIVDKVMVFTAPKIIGGVDSVASIGGRSPALLKKAFQIKNLKIRKIAEDILIEGYI